MCVGTAAFSQGTANFSEVFDGQSRPYVLARLETTLYAPLPGSTTAASSQPCPLGDVAYTRKLYLGSDDTTVGIVYSAGETLVATSTTKLPLELRLGDSGVLGDLTRYADALAAQNDRDLKT